ncbi:4Fe-4S binding protein [Selenihalanaerobacter shriftii]|uniref:2-oxoglutarate ferredoxin oxidoreductase, delta subunit n=1 Tax=Selenihalanaerobacter shriftii TaxID=142842 RepID=A0A1T4R9G8_9FIRM|nr:4Fe-4S binding protein [Selenihalanaerobacter shriftii]SKA12466.1 2-oxoglutarate ferredoxin oxidoreductase, delta subunit [Selenihalanaerobacter shriftii]
MAEVKFSQDRCKGCELCTTVCPKDIVVMADEINIKGFHPAAVTDVDECIACGFCANICPDVVIEVFK